jgi:transcriptional regulator with XRE-family HTH domain
MLPLCRKTLVSPKARPSTPPRTLGERLKAWRLGRGLDQAGAAREFGVRRATYGRWERDQKRPAMPYIPRVIELVGLPALLSRDYGTKRLGRRRP